MHLVVAAVIVAVAIAYLSAPLKLWTIASELKAIRKLLEEQARVTTR
jgi:hypothetical protein